MTQAKHHYLLSSLIGHKSVFDRSHVLFAFSNITIKLRTSYSVQDIATIFDIAF